MSDIVTRCPQCNTAFRVTENQLSVADGVVRCGSCLAVFKALDYNVNETAETDETSATIRQHIENADLQEDDLNESLIDDSDDDNGLTLNDDIYDLDIDSRNKKTSLFDRQLKPITQHTRESADESWALDMLADLEDDDDIQPLKIQRRSKEEQHQKEEPHIAPFENAQAQTDAPVTTDTPLSMESEPSALSEPLASDEEEPLDIDLSDLDIAEPHLENTPSSAPLLDDFDHERIEETKEAQIAKATEISAQEDESSSIEQLYFYHDEDEVPADEDKSSDSDHIEPYIEPFSDIGKSQISDEEIEHAMHSRTNYADENTGYLNHIQPAPVELEWYEFEHTKRWLWVVGALVTGLLLVTQVAIFRFDTLSKDPTYRPYYQTACKLFNCQLPGLIDTQKIRIVNLVVRRYIDEPEKAMEIDLILLNNADFTQPYPAIRLEFSGANNPLIAARNLQPAEYLRGELAGATLMPANQPIQLSLAIIDPGEAAENYQLTVIKAAPR